MPRGGKRTGAGRPKMLAEPTERVRVPVSMIEDVQRFVKGKAQKLPLYACTVQAGYAAAGDDSVESHIDISDYLVKNPVDTFLVRAQGLSMKDAGINDGALLLVDRSVKPTNGKIVVAVINGEMTVKYLIRKHGTQYLMPANPAFPEIPIDTETGATIWGVVRSAINEY